MLEDRLLDSQVCSSTTRCVSSRLISAVTSGLASKSENNSMAFVRWIVGGVIGGLVGGLVWVLLGHYANVEVGYVAWGIGILVGLGVRYGAQSDDQEESVVQGVVAAAIALGAVVLAKFLVFQLAIGSALAGIDMPQVTDEMCYVRFADAIVEEQELEGRHLKWPPGMTLDEASEPDDYPQGIWQDAVKRFDALTDVEQAEVRAELEENMELFRENLAAEIPFFTSSFGLYDLLWIFLAVASAFRLAIGSNES